MTVTVWVLAADSVTVKTALTVPLLPSVTDTSLMEMVGGGASSSTMVPWPCASAIVALVGLREVDEERLVPLGERCPRWTATVMVPGGLSRRVKVSVVGGDGRVVAAGRGRAVGGGVLTVTVWLLAADSVTVKTALTVPLLPSVTDTSLMEMVGGGGLAAVVNDQVKSAARGLPAASLTPLAPPLTRAV